jgi:DNA-binding NtrC family response regulator
VIFKILILDDEAMVCNSLRRVLADDERKIYMANTGEEAYKILSEHKIDLLLLDYKLKGEDGLTFLKQIYDVYPELLTIMLTAHGNVELAVKAMKHGAYDFIQKKEEPEFIRFNIQRALDNLRLKKEVEELKEHLSTEKNLPKIIAKSKQMKDVLTLAGEFALSDSTILIGGETGTGKSILAEFIHGKSNRFNFPLVQINCSAIPGELIESELFGYERGAFTGARQKGKKGLIEQANNGTLFLDEIGELSLEMQAKLLHILEKKEFLKVGAVEPTKVDVRFIAATNADLEKKVAEKSFRMDLFYRLNIASLEIPPLRERKEDILPLAKVFINAFNEKFNKSVRVISQAAENFLLRSPWLGNVRELRNYIERAMILKQGSELLAGDFNGSAKMKETANAQSAAFRFELNYESGENLLHTVQKELINSALKITKNNISKTALLLGMPRTSLNSCIQRFQIEIK